MQENHEAIRRERLFGPTARSAPLSEVMAKADARIRAVGGTDRRQHRGFVGELREYIGEWLLDRLLS